MSDRQLLEDAAKAAGYELEWDMLRVAGEATQYRARLVRPYTNLYPLWNPLIDDGDCERLETACRLCVIWGDGFVTVGNDRAGLRSEAFEEHAGNENAARRRASTRAAAAISTGREG